MAFDATDSLDQAKTVTSNGAAVLRGLIDAGENGLELFLDQLRPLAQQFDDLFADPDNPIPAPPAGGVPVNEPVASTDAEAATAVGVVAP